MPRTHDTAIWVLAREELVVHHSEQADIHWDDSRRIRGWDNVMHSVRAASNHMKLAHMYLRLSLLAQRHPAARTEH